MIAPWLEILPRFIKVVGGQALRGEEDVREKDIPEGGVESIPEFGGGITSKYSADFCQTSELGENRLKID